MSPGRITDQSHTGPAHPDPFSTIRLLGCSAVTAAIYFVTGKLALFVAIPPGYATAVCPSAGLALGCLLLFGNNAWPGGIIGSFRVSRWPSLDDATFSSLIRSMPVPAFIGAGAALQARTGAL